MLNAEEGYIPSYFYIYPVNHSSVKKKYEPASDRTIGRGLRGGREQRSGNLSCAVKKGQSEGGTSLSAVS